MMRFPSPPPKKGLFLSEQHPRSHRAAALRLRGREDAAQPRLIYATGYNDGLQPRRNSQQFPPSVDTGFQHWLFLLPTSIFIQLVQNQGCKCSGLDAEWVRAALAPSKSEGGAAILTHAA